MRSAWSCRSVRELNTDNLLARGPAPATARHFPAPPPPRYGARMKRWLLCLSLALLSACPMQAMSEKLVPDDVRAEVAAQIDALVAGDVEFILEAFPEERSNPEFREQITRMAGNVPDADVLSRDVVGVQASTEQAYSTTEGAVRTGTYNLANELEFSDGRFLLVQTAHTLDDAGECCVLRAINASRHSESPVKSQLARQARVMKGVGLLLLLSTLATIAFLIIRIGGRAARARAEAEGRL